MLRRKTIRRLTVGALVVAAAGAAMMTAGVASAAPPPGTLGSLTTTPAEGSDIIAPRVRTSTGCTAAGSEAYNVVVTGPGAFAAGYLITSTSSAGFSATDPFDIFFGVSMKDAATDLGTTIVAGEYPVTANCVDGFSNVTGTFTTSLYFTSPTRYQSTDPNQPITTSTALAVSPNSPVTQGTAVTLTATVTPPSATGTVQFKSGANNVGSSVTVSGGTAALTTTELPVGVQSLTAAFTGSAPNIQPSTSPAVSYEVTAAAATPTTTALSVNPSGSVPQFSTVTLTATVAPAAAAGTVRFEDNGSPLGAPVAVSGGSATFTTSTLAVGGHSLVARFAPSDPAVYEPSASGAVPLDVTPFAGVSASQNITTEVRAGELLISVENQNVTLPSPTLKPDGTLFVTGGALNPITVTDTRAGNPGWNVSGQVTDFSDGASHLINGANLGWTPQVVDKVAAQTITAGPVVNPAVGLAPGTSAPPGVGLGSSRTLATAATLAGNGTAHLGADLALNVPTSTVAGVYTAILTLTAI